MYIQVQSPGVLHLIVSNMETDLAKIMCCFMSQSSISKKMSMVPEAGTT